MQILCKFCANVCIFVQIYKHKLVILTTFRKERTNKKPQISAVYLGSGNWTRTSDIRINRGTAKPGNPPCPEIVVQILCKMLNRIIFCVVFFVKVCIINHILGIVYKKGLHKVLSPVLDASGGTQEGRFWTAFFLWAIDEPNTFFIHFSSEVVRMALYVWDGWITAS